LSSRGPHGNDGYAGIDLADDALHHLAALVDLDDECVCLVPAIERDSLLGPLMGSRTSERGILQHMADAVAIDAGHDQPATIGALRRGCRRIDGNGDPGERPWLPLTRRLDHRACPERVGAFLDDLAVEFLTAESRSAIGLRDRADEFGGEV